MLESNPGTAEQSSLAPSGQSNSWALIGSSLGPRLIPANDVPLPTPALSPAATQQRQSQSIAYMYVPYTPNAMVLSRTVAAKEAVLERRPDTALST